jgi:hypothetical protein
MKSMYLPAGAGAKLSLKSEHDLTGWIDGQLFTPCPSQDINAALDWTRSESSDSLSALCRACTLVACGYRR